MASPAVVEIEDEILLEELPTTPRPRTKWRLVAIVGISVVLALAIALTLAVVLNGHHDVEVSPDPGPGPPPPGPSFTLPPPLRVPRAAVAADNPICSQVGSDVMRDGGNAVDAAVAVCICQGVLSPFASGIGGGMIMTVRMADGRVASIDGREQAPGAAHRDMYVQNPSNSSIGALSIAVPGELAGLEYAWNRYRSGNVTWQRIFEPSIRLAQNHNATQLLVVRLSAIAADVLRDPGMSGVYAPHGRLVQVGEAVSNSRLAATLQAVADQGASAFYTGPIAQNMVNDVQQAGGILTMADLANYTVRERKLMETFFHGLKVYSPPPPFGGSVLVESLNIIEKYNLPMLHARGQDALAMHWWVESLKFAYGDRMALGDPDFVNISAVIQDMGSKDYAALLRQRLSANTTHNYTYYTSPRASSVPEDHGTTHISVVDPWRNSVAVTSTVNLNFGSRFMSPLTGIIMNDEMDDFSTPNVSNAFGYPPSASNFIVPGKRPMSSMSPTIVTKDDRPFIVAGTSGGSRIITGTLNAIIGHVAFGLNANEMVNLPRLHCQLTPVQGGDVVFETGLSTSVVDKLRADGNTLAEVPYGAIGNAVQVITQDDDGLLYAASDFRKFGAPAGF